MRKRFSSTQKISPEEEFKNWSATEIEKGLTQEALKRFIEGLSSVSAEEDGLHPKSILLLVYIYNFCAWRANNGELPVCTVSNARLAQILGMKNGADVAKIYLKPLIREGFVSRANSPKTIHSKNKERRRFKTLEFRYLFCHVSSEIPNSREILELYITDPNISKETVNKALKLAETIDPGQIQTSFSSLESSFFNSALLALGSANAQTFRAPFVEGRILDFLDENLFRKPEEDIRRHNLARALKPKTVELSTKSFELEEVLLEDSLVNPDIYEELEEPEVENYDILCANDDNEDIYFPEEPKKPVEEKKPPEPKKIPNAVLRALAEIEEREERERKAAEEKPVEVSKPVSDHDFCVPVPVTCNWDPKKGPIGPPPLLDANGNTDWNRMYDFTEEQIDLLNRQANGEFIKREPVPEGLEDADYAVPDFDPDYQMRYYNDDDLEPGIEIVRPYQPKNKEEFEVFVEEAIEKELYTMLSREEVAERMEKYPSGKFAELMIDYTLEVNHMREYGDSDFDHITSISKLLEDDRITVELFLGGHFKYQVAIDRVYPDFVCKEVRNRLKSTV